MATRCTNITMSAYPQDAAKSTPVRLSLDSDDPAYFRLQVGDDRPVLMPLAEARDMARFVLDQPDPEGD